jgi:NAD(P)-dependent dehydrogenase (short-subunit alcohol dehydrogenase family)
VPLSTQRHPISGLYLLTADADGVAERLADRIVGAGGIALILPQAVVGDDAALKSAIERARAQHGAVRGLVHLRGAEKAAIEDLGAWRAAAALHAKTLFRLLQLCGPDFSANESVALSTARLGGSLGREAEGSGAVTAGAAVGLFNCAMAEWAPLRARLVDFESQASADFMADALFDELGVAERRSEVGYSNAKGSVERLGFVHKDEAVADNPFAPHLAPSGDWVVLITGGARGITAEVAEELVRPGMRLVLLGRTPAPGPEDARFAGLSSEAQLKKALLERAVAAGRKPTPAELGRELGTLLAEREIRSNLARLATAGAQVDYCACDVRDAAAFGALIDQVYAKYGRIDAVLHGAGVIEDKRIGDKTQESFDRVYDTKVDSAFVLARKLRPESLKLLSFFTSVAGRFGNVGQADYGAANETLNRLAWQLHRQWPGVRVVSINWGPWDAGMATDAVRAGFKSKGVEPIPVSAGRRFFLDEMAYGPRNDVELVAGRGPWEREAELLAGLQAGTPAGEPAAVASFPLIRKAPRVGVGGAVVFEHALSLGSDPYLIDHCMDGKPVLPAAGAVEYMAEFVAAGYPEWRLAELRDVRMLQGIVMEGRNARDILLRARSSTHSEAGQQAVTVEILDPARKTAHYRATAILMTELPPAPQGQADGLPAGEHITAERAYSEFLFHGPRFRLITDIPNLTDRGIDALVKPSSPALFLEGVPASAYWLFDPGLVDTGPQLAFAWARVHRDKGALPSRFGRLARYGEGPITGPLRLVMRLKPAPHEHGLLYDAQFIDAAGRVRLEVVDGESTMSPALNRLAPNHRDFVAGLMA